MTAPAQQDTEEPTMQVPNAFDPFQLMDRFDDEALQKELAGRAVDTLVYRIKEGGQEVVGLSKEGVDECCMALVEQGQVIREEEAEFVILGEGDDSEALFKVKAARFAVSAQGVEVRLDQVLGVKRQPLFYEPQLLDLNSKVPGKKYRGKTYRELLNDDEGRDYLGWMAENFNDTTIRDFVHALLSGEQPGDVKPGRRLNPHWYEQGMMKAARNARFRLIPSKTKQAVIASAIASGKVKDATLSDHAQQARAQPAQQTLLEQALALKLPGREGAWGGYAGKLLAQVPTEILTAVDDWALDKSMAEEDNVNSADPAVQKRAVETQHRMGALSRACEVIVKARADGALQEPPHKNGTPRDEVRPADGGGNGA